MDKVINKRLSELGVADEDDNIPVKKEYQNNFSLVKRGNAVFANGGKIGYVDKFRVVDISSGGRDIGCKWETKVVIENFDGIGNINNTNFSSNGVSLGQPGMIGCEGRENKRHIYFERYFKDSLRNRKLDSIELYSVTRKDEIKDDDLEQKDVIRNG